MHVKAVFEELRAKRLYMNGKNTITFSRKLCYKSPIIFNGGIIPQKIKVIEDGLQLKNLYEESNLSLLYYRYSLGSL